MGNNQNPNNFDNPSNPLAFQNSQSPEMNQNQDNQNSWGYWADHIQNENNISKIDQDIAKIDEDIAKKSEESNSGVKRSAKLGS